MDLKLDLKPDNLISVAALLEWRADFGARVSALYGIAPTSDRYIDHVFILRAFDAALEKAATCAPTCDSQRAGKIMGVSSRQAVNLAANKKVKASQNTDHSPWVFDVRSCYAYAARHGRGESE